MKRAVVAGGLLACPVAAQVGVGAPAPAAALPTCSVTAQPLAFGLINQVTRAATDSQTAIVLTCTAGVTYEIGLDFGVNGGGGSRRLRSAAGAAIIPYGLFSNASRTAGWGNSVGVDTVRGVGGTGALTVPVFGRIPGDAPLVPAGEFTDTITVSITF